MRRSGSLALFLLLSACTEHEAAYDDAWGSDILLGGKADGLLDTSMPIAYGDTVTGSVGHDALVLYRLRTQQNDRFTVTMAATSGDLNPHVQLFVGTFAFVDAVDIEVEPGRVTKEYVVASTGDHALVARAFKGEGAGEFELTLTCTRGPCAGEFPPPEEGLDAGDANRCISRARKCVTDRLPSLGTAVGPSRSRKLWDQCLAEQSTFDGESCETACEGTEICDELVADLPFYADQPPACMARLTECMDACYDAGDVDENDALEDIFGVRLPEEVCWSGPLSGSCRFWPRETEACGGPMPTAERAECMSLCRTTAGAWIDDLDILCEEECGFCDDVEEECAAECDDSTCEQECIAVAACD
jgi:hypothetical protein